MTNPQEPNQPKQILEPLEPQELNMSEGIEGEVEFEWVENTEQGLYPPIVKDY